MGPGKTRNQAPRRQHRRPGLKTEIPLIFILIALAIMGLISMILIHSIHDEHVNQNQLLFHQTKPDITSKIAPKLPFGSRAPDSNQATAQYQVVFSTACSPQQHWESYVLFYHAWKVQQPGNVTRIASGCKEHEARKLEDFHKQHISTMSTRFHLHLTPDYSRVRKAEGKYPYKYMNKPFGLRHWMENVLGYPTSTAHDDAIIMLMDPDMILTKPLTHDFSKDGSTIWVDKPKDPTRLYVRHGNPMSQQDGYLHSNWMDLNVTYITGDPQSPASRLKHPDGPKSYNTGPPYLVTSRDMYGIVTRWTEYAPRVHDVFPKLFAEMFGYCFATAQLELPHTMVKSIVVSTTMSRDREGWPLVDALDSVCPFPTQSAEVLPTILHYCKRYMAGRFFWSKYRLRKDYLSCEAPMLTMPPPNITDIDWWLPIPTASGNVDNQKVQKISSKRITRREAFMLCGMIEKVNEAVEYWKKQHCGDTANLDRTYNFHDDPKKHD